MPHFQEATDQLFEQLVEWRRDFHRHPELGFEENRTSAIIAERLENLGLQVRTGIAGTGVAGLLTGAKPGPTAMLRVDMDALPIQENTEVEYASVNAGVMHACGHDGHMAIGLGVAQVMSQYKADLPGSINFIFQPAEEGLGGAAKMIDEGVLDSPQPDFALGVHLWNTEPVGWFGIGEGARMAAADILDIEIVGQGGHGAVPQLARDPVIAAAHIITALQTIVSRNVDPARTAVISITEIHGGETFNVIPEIVKLRGTIRTFDPKVRTMVLERIEQIADQGAASLGCQASVAVTLLTPALMNDPVVTARVRRVAESLFPEADVSEGERIMGSEDMALFLDRVPGCFLFVGSRNSQLGLDASHHNPRFNFDERALSLAVNLISQALWDMLEKP